MTIIAFIVNLYHAVRFLQVALLKRLRDQNRQPPISEDLSIDSSNSSRTYSRSELLRGALLTINGIAAGMRNTG